jgi:hypothetical protein
MAAPCSRRIDGQHVGCGEIRVSQLLEDVRLSHHAVRALNAVVVDPTTKNDVSQVARRSFD